MAVYDAFLFFNELDLLEVRLHELASVVDYFVLLESDRTHGLSPKRYVFQTHRHRFRPFLSKILYVDLPWDGESHDWAAEQRRELFQFLKRQTLRRDFVLFSACDEIPSQLAVQAAIKKHQGTAHFSQSYACYYVNRRSATLHSGSIIFPATFFYGPDLSDQFQMQKGSILPSGWHFSKLGGAAAIQKKLWSLPDAEKNHPKFTDIRYIESCRRAGSDLFGDKEQRFMPYHGADYPEYLIRNRQRFASWFEEFSECHCNAQQVSDIS